MVRTGTAMLAAARNDATKSRKPLRVNMRLPFSLRVMSVFFIVGVLVFSAFIGFASRAQGRPIQICR